MEPGQVFQLVNPLAMSGWLALLLSPLAPRAAQVWVFAVIVAQSVLYAGLVLAFWAWAVRVARAEGLAHWMVLRCLALTFLFGPAGLLAFAALRFTLTRKVLP